MLDVSAQCHKVDSVIILEPSGARHSGHAGESARFQDPSHLGTSGIHKCTLQLIAQSARGVQARIELPGHLLRS